MTARFGWAPKTKVVWKKGKREEELLPQIEPFVAELAPPLPEHEDAGTQARRVDARLTQDASHEASRRSRRRGADVDAESR